MYKVSNIEEFNNFVKEFFSKIKPLNSKAVVIALKGDLGAGKTTFTQMLAKELGIEETITSPTFVIQKRYKIKKGPDPFKKLIHIDAYRLESSDELLNLDWKELISNPENIICLEWPERVADIIPEDSVVIELEIDERGGRKITTNV
jgi:tRNA threonylcarbamoyladenosine biosynthesis protein TsaE